MTTFISLNWYRWTISITLAQYFPSTIISNRFFPRNVSMAGCHSLSTLLTSSANSLTSVLIFCLSSSDFINLLASSYFLSNGILSASSLDIFSCNSSNSPFILWILSPICTLSLLNDIFLSAAIFLNFMKAFSFSSTLKAVAAIPSITAASLSLIPLFISGQSITLCRRSDNEQSSFNSFWYFVMSFSISAMLFLSAFVISSTPHKISFFSAFTFLCKALFLLSAKSSILLFSCDSLALSTAIFSSRYALCSWFHFISW